MKEEQFWEYIELGQDSLSKFNNIRAYEYYQTNLIKEALIRKPFQEILNFHKAYTQKANELLLPNVVELYVVSHHSFEELKNG